MASGGGAPDKKENTVVDREGEERERERGSLFTLVAVVAMSGDCELAASLQTLNTFAFIHQNSYSSAR